MRRKKQTGMAIAKIFTLHVNAKNSSKEIKPKLKFKHFGKNQSLFNTLTKTLAVKQEIKVVCLEKTLNN